MKVAQLTSVHYAYDTRIFIKQCRSLISVGFDVCLIAPLEADTTKDGVAVKAVLPWKTRHERIRKTVPQVLKRALAERADLYHLHDPELLSIALILKAMGKRVVFDAHEDIPGQILGKHWIPEGRRKLVSNIYAGLEPTLCGAVDAVIAATPTIAERYPKSKTHLVQNFPILGELKSDGLASRDPSRFVYLGGLSRERGAMPMLEALKIANQTAPVFMDFIGEIKGEDLKKEMHAHAGWAFVHDHGFRGREEVKKILSGCATGLVLFDASPNHVKAQPNKLFEYISAGLAVIASDFPLWRKLVKDTGGGVNVDQGSPQAIAEAMLEFATTPEKAKVMGAKGQAAIYEKYNWDNEFTELLRCYARLGVRS